MKSRASLHPLRPGRDVLHEERDRDDQAGHESTSRLVVPTKEEVHRDDDGYRQQQARDDRRDHHVSARRIVGAARLYEVGDDVGRQHPLLLRRSMLSAGGRKRRRSAYTVSATAPSTVISPMVSKARKSTSMTLTTFVPPPSGSARLEEERRDALRSGPRQHGVRERSEPATGTDREQQVTRPPRPVAQRELDSISLPAASGAIAARAGTAWSSLPRRRSA